DLSVRLDPAVVAVEQIGNEEPTRAEAPAPDLAEVVVVPKPEIRERLELDRAEQVVLRRGTYPGAVVVASGREIQAEPSALFRSDALGRLGQQCILDAPVASDRRACVVASDHRACVVAHATGAFLPS